MERKVVEGKGIKATKKSLSVFVHLAHSSHTVYSVSFVTYCYNMDVEKLIILVRNRREIYDANDPNHRNKDYITSVWRSTAEELQTTGLDESKTFSFAFFPSSFAIF
jgi:hypothetical protein